MPENRGRIHRSRLLAHPLEGRAGLLRELGTSQDHGAVFDVWARGLGHRQLWSLDRQHWREDAFKDVFTTFVYDEASKNIVAGVCRDSYSDPVAAIMALGKKSGFPVHWPDRNDQILQSVITSISLSPSRSMLMTTRHGCLPAGLYSFNLDQASSQYSLGRSMIALNHSGEYWASAANPRHGPGSFAIAASNGCCIYFKEEDQWVLERNLCIQGLREAVAVDWLGPNVVLKGCREGAVRLWDHRSHAESTEPRIQHAVAVNHVRRIDENLVVVAGLKNELCTYDLRYSKRASPFHATQPYDRFPTYRNESLNHLSVGLDVHHNLVAAATDDRRVQIFDVKKGVELVSGIKDLTATAACVRFVNEQRSGNGLRLMVAAAGQEIDAWAFEGPGERAFFDTDRKYYSIS